MSIHIKKSHKGLLHKNLGIPEGKPIPASKLKVKPTDSAAVKKRKVFAQNARHWNKGQDGLELNPQSQYNWYQPDQNVPAMPIQPRNLSQYRPDMSQVQLPGNTVQDPKLYNWHYQNNNPPTPYHKQGFQNSNGEIGKGLLSGLLLADALIPKDRPKLPVVRQTQTFNPYPYGTGSQAIAEHGLTVSRTGYKRNSKDKNKPSLRIPSGNITMTNVPHPVMGVDNLGNAQMMMPEHDYQFPGSYVDEYPMAQAGGTFTSPAQVDAANAEARRFGAAHNLAHPESLYVARNVGDAIPAYMYPGGNPLGNQLRSLPTSVPKDVQLSDIQTSNGTAYYTDPTTGYLVNVDPSVVNSPRFRKSTQQQNQDMANMVASKEYGGTIDLSTPLKYGGTEAKPVSSPTYFYGGPISLGDYLQEHPGNAKNPHVKQLFGYHMDSGGQLSAGKAAEMLKDGTAHGKKLTAKQKKYFQAVAHGWQPAENGLQIATWPFYGKAKNGVTLLDENTVQFNGPSHDNGGIDIAYAGKRAEVEGDETGYISPLDNSLTIMGNMKNPLTGRKFKQDSKILSKKEQNMNKLLEEGFEMIDKNSPYDTFDHLKFNAGRVMMAGAAQKKQELIQSKEHLRSLQQAMLDFSNENKLDPQEFSQGKMKYGGTMKAQWGMTTGDGRRVTANKYAETQKPNSLSTGWDYRGTNTEGLDEDIKKFVTLLQKKGYTGFSGSESGISQRNTKSGNLSRHAKGEALDTFLSQPDAYNKVLNDPDLSKFLVSKGLTVINEYDPKVAKQTGATAGHLHIGYDRGTAISDQFRKDAAAKYKSSNPDWGWGTTRAPKGSPIKNGPAGDQQYFPITTSKVKYNDVTNNTVPTANPNPTPDYNFNFTNPGPRHLPTDAQPLEFSQVLPELYAAATSQPEAVFMQQYNPQLFQPYNVSFQDQRNENQATFSAMAKANAYHPSTLAPLAAQKYSADSASLANEFRANQQIYSDVVNKNVGLLNDAQLKNLQLADTQYVRQNQAKSNSKAINHNVLNSISAKLLENEANNRKLQVYENLYDYRFSPNDGNMEAKYMGAPGWEYVDWTGGEGNMGAATESQSMRQNFDKKGNLTSTSVMTPSSTDQQLKRLQLQNKEMGRFPGIYNSTKKTGKMNFPDLMSSFLYQ